MKNTETIFATKENDMVICTFPNGKIVELSMVSVHGEDVTVESNVQAALTLIKNNIDLFMTKKVSFK